MSLGYGGANGRAHVTCDYETRMGKFRLGAVALLAWLILGASAACAGETRCWLDKGAVVVPAVFGDIAGDFLLDLARPVSAVHDTRANADGLSGAAATRTLRLAGEDLGPVTLPIVDLDSQTRDFDTTINGVLGADLFADRILTLDFRDGGCRLGLARRARLPRGARLDVQYVGGVPAIRAVLSDGTKSREGLFSLGTAQAATIISRAHLARADSAAAPARLRALELAGRLFEQIPAQVGPGPGGLSGAIGSAILAHGRLTLDGRRGVLILTDKGYLPWDQTSP